MTEKKFKRALVIAARLLALCALIAAVTLKFYPKYDKVLDAVMKFSVRANITSGEIDYIKDKFTLSSIIGNEVKNPLTAADDKSAKDTSLQAVDDDIAALIEQAQEQRESTELKKGGKVIDRTYTTMENVISSGNVKIQNNTKKSVDIPAILEQGANLSISDLSEPTVLIYHSHTCESYLTLDEDIWYKGFTARSDDNSQNVVRVGDAICEQLEAAGINVIHDTTVYDSDYPNAYSASGEGIQKILDKYPSIKVAIDIHRDAVDSGTTKYRPITEIEGKRAAQIMIITGCEEDYITDFPHWKQNLKFAVCLQDRCEQMYPTLMRPIYFADRRYNMYKLYNSVLIEMGSDGNTLDQAVYSGKLLGSALADLLEDYVDE